MDKLGFIEDMPNEKYHSLDGISKSGLDKIARSPAHYKHAKQKDPTRAMEIGTAIHTAILEPERYDSEYIVTPAQKRTEKAYKDAKAVNGSELTLTEPEGAKVLGMRQSVESNFKALQALRLSGKSELSAICIDPETGIKIRARFDRLSDCGIAVDVKKTQDVRAFKFSRSVQDFRYHVQDAMYSFIYKQITGEDLKAFYFLAVEEEAPHSCQMYQLDDLSKEMGAFYFRRDLRLFADCFNNDDWPHPEPGDGIIELSNWAVSEYENDLEVIL